MSISTVCLLSVFQAITISPMNSCWKDPKVEAPQNVGFCVFFFWTQYTFVNLIFPMYTLYMLSKWSMTNITETWGTVLLLIMRKKQAQCMRHWQWSLKLYFLSSQSGPEASLLSSFTDTNNESNTFLGSVSPILCRVQSYPEHPCSGEHLCVFFYTLSSIFHIPYFVSHNPNWWSLKTSALISVFFNH